MKEKDIGIYTDLAYNAFPELEGKAITIKITPHSHKPYNFIYFTDNETGNVKGLAVKAKYIKAIKEIFEHYLDGASTIWGFEDTDKDADPLYPNMVNKLLICFDKKLDETHSVFSSDLLTNGDYLKADEDIVKVVNKLTNIIKNKVVTLTGLYAATFPMEQRDHNLIGTFALSDDKLVQFCLDKIPAINPVGGVEIKRTPVDVTQYDSKYINQILDALNEFNTLSVRPYFEHFCFEEIEEYRQKLFDSLLVKTIYQPMRTIYTIDKSAVNDLITEQTNIILTELKDIGGDVRLDVNSFEVWKHEPDKEPYVIKDPSFMNGFFVKYTKEFGELVYAALMSSGSEFVRPHTEMKKVDTDEIVNDNVVRFKSKPVLQ